MRESQLFLFLTSNVYQSLLVFTIPTRTRILYPTERQTQRITGILQQFKAICSIRRGNNCSVPMLRGRRSVIDRRALYGTGGHRSDWANLRLRGCGGSARLSVNGHLWRHGGSRDRASCVCGLRDDNEWVNCTTRRAHINTRHVHRHQTAIARICCEEGQSWKLGKGALRTGCSSGSMTNSFVINAVLIERAVSCWHLRKLLWQITQYLDSWLSDLL